MFSHIAGHLKSAFHAPPVARLAQPTMQGSARMAAITTVPLAPGAAARHLILSPSGIPRGSDVAPPLRARSASFLPPGVAPPPRDWPNLPQDAVQFTPEARAATLDAARASRGTAVRHEVRERAFRTGEGIEPGYAASVTAINMVFGLSRPAERLLAQDGPGVAAGLRTLAIAPGDRVAELDPDSPDLAVHLALQGSRAFLVLTHPARQREIGAELDRFAQGQTDPIRELSPDFKPLHPPEHYRDGARAVARHLSLVKGTGLGDLPYGTGFKALFARGVFEYLDTPAIEAALADAGRLLVPGGGLVFEFAHAAGTPSHPQSPKRLNRVSFRQLDAAARRAGLGLQCVNVRFRVPDRPQQALIPTRRVREDAKGWVHPDLADTAAWTGWNEIARLDKHTPQPVLVDVSGVYVKQAPAIR